MSTAEAPRVRDAATRCRLAMWRVANAASEARKHLEDAATYAPSAAHAAKFRAITAAVDKWRVAADELMIATAAEPDADVDVALEIAGQLTLEAQTQ